MAMISKGQLVTSAVNDLGTGKATAAAPGDCIVVQYFHSVAEPDIEHVVPRASLRPAPAMPQTRGYFRNSDGDWAVGRVIWRQDGEYGLRLAGGYDHYVLEKDLYVRWAKPINDPTEVMILRGNESPYFHNRRQPFVRSLLEQRAASQGLNGILSSVVELHAHQVEIARRVLQDPVQRYLLADEVGLGKTIEAGLIIRQFLLDHPSGRVLIIVPPLLIPQWQAELEEKFLIDDFRSAKVEIISFDDILARDPEEAWDLLVVDEAHHLAAGYEHANQELRDRYRRLARMSMETPRLLLLSATPVLNNEKAFLAMLHLVDPELHNLDDLDAFTERVRNRQDLGTLFYTFRPDTPGFLLREKVSALRTLFAKDIRLRGLLDDVDESLDRDGDSRTLYAAVQAARVHVSETYRLHRRLLRTRRDESLLRTFPVRGRRLPEFVKDIDPQVLEMNAWLDQWRDSRLTAFLGGQEQDSGRDQALLRLFLDRGSSIPALIGALARYRRLGEEADAIGAGLSESEREMVHLVPVTRDEEEFLTQAEELFGPTESLDGLPTRLRAAVDLLAYRPARSKNLVFTSFPIVAELLHKALASEFGADAAALHLTTQTPDDAASEVQRFNRDPACVFLVCDRSGEEGRNFQNADFILHMDIPWAPNRLEQRLGRVDRFGLGPPAQSAVFVSGKEETYLDSWVDVLTRDFQIFSSSIASLQYAVDDLSFALLEATWSDGAPGLRGKAADIPSRLSEEREHIVQQDALDSIEIVEGGDSLVQSMTELERNWKQLQDAGDNLIAMAEGNLRFHRSQTGDVVTYSFVDESQRGRPALNTMPLIAWDQLLTVFLRMIGRPGSWNRVAALATPRTRLFRSGDQFIERLGKYVRWDDRGQCFILWRPLRQFDGKDDIVAFRFDFVIEADSSPMVGALGKLGLPVEGEALQRRADAFFQPIAETIWLDLRHKTIEDPEILRLLEIPYSNTRDINVHADRRWMLDQVISAEDWEQACRGARAASEEALKERVGLDAKSAASAARAHEVMDVAQTQLQIRVDSAKGKSEQRYKHELRLERELSKGLVAGIVDPIIRLDSIGLVVLSGRVPEEPNR